MVKNCIFYFAKLQTAFFATHFNVGTFDKPNPKKEPPCNAIKPNTIKRISNKPKGYIADTGLACMLNMISSHNALGGHPMTGALFETAVVGEIRKLSNTLQPLGMYHWRSHGASEVDLIMEQNGIISPIEIKLTSNPTKKDIKVITAFRKTYPNLKIAPGLVICPC